MTTEDSQIIVINNAGLVLYWPFLTQFYERLALLKDGEFVDNESRNRAVYLLQYLAYNQTDFPKYKLVLNRLLVGMTLVDNLSSPIRLTNKEIEVSKSLMYGMINNWEKVKDSTPEGVQETFIKREGLLTIMEEKSELTIEKKGVDVLLDFLPWDISIIKLLWMPNPIHVTWI